MLAHRAASCTWPSSWVGRIWKLAFTIGYGQKPRQRTIRARDLAALEQEIAKAKKRFQLADAAPVVSCYEAGRDGFWLHRYLTARGLANVIVDSASIEVNRRKRRVKSDKLDADKLVNMLIRYHAGERKVWSVVWVPSVADEDQRQLHREPQELKDDQTRHSNRIKGLLASQGLALDVVDELLPGWLEMARLWDGTAVGADLQRRLLREYERWRSCIARSWGGGDSLRTFLHFKGLWKKYVFGQQHLSVLTDRSAPLGKRALFTARTATPLDTTPRDGC